MIVLLTVYVPVGDAWFGKFWKCLKWTAIFAAATSSMMIACGGAIASIIIDGGTLETLFLSTACLGSISHWYYARSKFRR